jgi:acetyl esterase/lipase
VVVGVPALAWLKLRARLDRPDRDRYLSPLFGDFSRGFPPTLMTSGTRDLLLSSTVWMHRALRAAGVAAELHVFEVYRTALLWRTRPRTRISRPRFAVSWPSSASLLDECLIVS